MVELWTIRTGGWLVVSPIAALVLASVLSPIRLPLSVGYRQFKKLKSIGLLLSITMIGLIVALSGCAAKRKQQTIHDARLAFANGHATEAFERLTEIAAKKSRHSTVASLDLAMVDLARGEPALAEKRLRVLRDQFDRMPTVAPLSETASLVTDDTVRQYRAAGYEQVMIRAMLAICSLAGDQMDAESYSLQAAMKQSELAVDAAERGLLGKGIKAGENAFQPIAFAPYLRGILREATHHDYDDATKAYQLVSQVQPSFLPAAEDIARASGGLHSQPGHGVLYVLACVGRGPVLHEVTAETTSMSLSLASAVINAKTNENGQSDNESSDNNPSKDNSFLPNIASVKVPAVSVPHSGANSLAARIDGQIYGATQTLTDVVDLAVRQTEAEMPWTIARAVARRATKETMVATARKQWGIDGTAGQLFHFAAASAWSASESADTRCWGLLPREIQVLRAELPAGDHQLELSPVGFDGQPIGSSITQTVKINDGQNHYVIALAPDDFIYVVSH